MDLNGDGLSDYLYHSLYQASLPMDLKSCVHLNTGSGWNRAYKCYGKNPTGQPNDWTFYGDCAA